METCPCDVTFDRDSMTLHHHGNGPAEWQSRNQG
jgi:hypothetical protein